MESLFARLAEGEPEVLNRLIPVVYRELKAIARNQLRGEAPGHTLQTTALVNEAYARLARERRISVANRTEFFGVASHAMRRVLVDYARKRKRKKRGGGADHVALDAVEEFLGEREADELLALDRALDQLSKLSARAALVVQHRFFAGLTIKETAQVLGLSGKTVARDWETARDWLRREVATHVSLLKGL
ncbi:MAG: sigma-70 family RNA polymerase sigma factor [Gemmatimonadetes bacterium]|nr:sigma-70 family RNA polymerase sigma factor [Gemmatimonadota bacterium]NNM33997.1 sigma-70 family RNA polymerase sigma factor [Gemmatimonadota bacterium]